MHFYATSDFAKDAALAGLDSATPDMNAFCQHWFLHRVNIFRRKYVIAMEGYSRYVIVFSGMKKSDFMAFQTQFAIRLWHHVATVCPVPDFSFTKIGQVTQDMCADAQWFRFQNRSVQSHIKDAFHQLRWLINDHGYPVDESDDFALSLRINNTLRSRHKEKRFIVPLEEFRRLWYDNLQLTTEQYVLN